MVIGAQVASFHYGSGASDMEWATPGIYAMHRSGVTASLYRNSQGRGSVMLGYTWQWFDGRLALTAGAVTGYERASVLPFVAPSVSVPLSDGWSVRVFAVPPLQKLDVIGAVSVGFEKVF